MLRDRITVLFFGDIVALVISLFCMAAIRLSYSTQSLYLQNQIRIFLFLFILWLIVFFIFDLYNVRRANPNPRNIGQLALAVMSASILSVLYFYIFPTNGTPKTNLLILAGFSFLLLVIWRRIFYLLYTSRYSQLIAIIGSGPAVDSLIKDIQAHPQIGQVIYEGTNVADIEAVPEVDVLISHGVEVQQLVRAAHQKQSDILSLAEAYEQLFGKVPLILLTEEKALSVFSKQKNLAHRMIERIIEMLFAVIILIVMSPFLAIAALAILIEDGKPIFYKQIRVGRHGKPFIMYKLRTMGTNAEAQGAQWATVNDPRSTKVGRILRKTHIDEVPQMFNLLKGEIALVGPRPERPEFVTELEQRIPYYFLRHTVKPGFTGWAQIKFRYARSELDSKEKFEYDLYYLFNKNSLLDIGIFLKTVQIIFTH
jgi:lipopolysaccharide/colanic/teichoic acid biosynthesis glycosyltransferase